MKKGALVLASLFMMALFSVSSVQAQKEHKASDKPKTECPAACKKDGASCQNAAECKKADCKKDAKCNKKANCPASKDSPKAKK